MSTQARGAELWTKETILQVENRVLQEIFTTDSPEATEAAMSYARFLRKTGLNSENYPLFLKMLGIENHWVLDELIGPIDPFYLLSTIPPNEYIVSRCFLLLNKWHGGGIYPKTLAIILGLLKRTYQSAREGYKIYQLSIADVDDLGKHLEEGKGQRHPQNRCILDILGSIGQLEGLRWDETMDQLAKQAVKIKGHFLDDTKNLESCIPKALLVRSDYLQNETQPQELFVD